MAGLSDKRTPIHLLERGDETKKLQPLGMRIPSVLLDGEVDELPQNTQQPKTKLAEWITSSNNPLPARVMVNRIWQYHFGRAIVPTANDFGMNGERIKKAMPINMGALFVSVIGLMSVIMGISLG